MLSDKNNYLQEDQLLDDFATFILKYKMSVEPQSRSDNYNMLDKILDLLHKYQLEYKTLLDRLEASKKLSEQSFIEKKEAEDKINQIYDDIQSLLNLPFEGKGNDLAHERIGQDKIVNYILTDILENYR